MLFWRLSKALMILPFPFKSKLKPQILFKQKGLFVLDKYADLDSMNPTLVALAARIYQQTYELYR
jgi:hypothetical protein